MSAEWKQQLKPQKLPHSEFFWQLCSHGNFQRAFNSLKSKNIPMNFWLSSATVNGFHELQCRDKSAQIKITAHFPKPLNNWKSRLWGGLLSLLVSSEKSYPAVSVRMTFSPLLCAFPTRRKKSAENHGWMLSWSISVDWVAGNRNWEGTRKQLGKREQDLGTWVYVKQENRLHSGKWLELQREVSKVFGRGRTK